MKFIHISKVIESTGTKNVDFYINADKIISFSVYWTGDVEGIKISCEGFSRSLWSEDIDFFAKSVGKEFG